MKNIDERIKYLVNSFILRFWVFHLGIPLQIISAEKQPYEKVSCTPKEGIITDRFQTTVETEF